MVQFVVPVEEAERQLAVITQTIKHSGRIVFLLGPSGTGKSTFIKSLTWRQFLPIPEIIEVDASKLVPSSKRLELLFLKLQRLVVQERRGNRGLFTLAINYLEDFSGQQNDDVKAFFRDVNGLLRNNPLLIIWPVTQASEADKMVQLASNVSSTVFANEPILKFSGPSIDLFPRIAKQTIAILNPGLNFDDFQLTEEDFGELLNEIKWRYISEQTIRGYLKAVREEWENRSG